jgi:phenylacetate-CoA ligase
MDTDPTADSPWPAETRTRLGELLGTCLAGNRFYQDKFQAAGCQGTLPGALREFSARFPLTTKRELVEDQAAHAPYGSNLSFPVGRYVRCHQTSGTTGLPLRWLDTAESWSAMTEDWVTVLQKAGITQQDRACFAFSFGPFLGFWLAFEAAGRLGVLSIAGGGMTSAQRARVIREQSCTVLCCTPTYALHLAEASRSEGLAPETSTIRLVLVAGEPGGSLPAVRKRLSQAWNGARVFDHHGMTETGPVTYEHPDRPGDLVVMEGSYLAEVIDPVTTAPVPPGTRGELVLTTLKRVGSPLIRYRTGDLVEARRVDGLLLLHGGILGRVDDMVVVRGVNVYPTALDSLIRSSASVGEYRVTVDRRSHLAELSVEIESEASEAVVVARRIQDSLALRVPVTAVAPGVLPRFELKARRWVTVG